MIYDLIVVGNGIAAQTFLFELFAKLDVLKSQNFSVAQIYSEEISPACSLRSTASVSLSGIEEGISELGNELSDSFFLFEEFQRKYRPEGVEKIRQFITFSSLGEKEKLMRRYKELKKNKHPILKKEMEAVELDSYLIDPILLNSWFNEQLSSHGIVRKKNFLKNLTQNSEGIIECALLSSEIIKTKKIVLCTGAYAQLFSAFYQGSEDLKKTQTVAGSFLERSINLNSPSFFVTIDGHHLIYRQEAQKLILGSLSQNGSIVMAHHQELDELLSLFNLHSQFSLGQLHDFKIVTGLRHKGQKRRPLVKALDFQKKIYMINGLYKNGYSFSHLCAKKIVSEINL